LHCLSSHRSQRGVALFGLVILIILLAGVVLLGLYMVKLDGVVRSKFEGKRWEIPAKVYARPMELFNGATLTPDDLKDELRLLKLGNMEQRRRFNLCAYPWL
jgi:penicillin-binding protein 1B